MGKVDVALCKLCSGGNAGWSLYVILTANDALGTTIIFILLCCVQV